MEVGGVIEEVAFYGVGWLLIFVKRGGGRKLTNVLVLWVWVNDPRVHVHVVEYWLDKEGWVWGWERR
jgi:hypothetical protein